MGNFKIKIIGGGLLTSRMAAMYMSKIPEVPYPWWLCEPGTAGGVQFVTPDGRINLRGGDPLAEYGIRPVLAVRMPGLKPGDKVTLVDRRAEVDEEKFTCIWTTREDNAMLFCDRVTELIPFRADNGLDYRGSDAEKAVQRFMDSMENRLVAVNGTLLTQQDGGSENEWKCIR